MSASPPALPPGLTVPPPPSAHTMRGSTIPTMNNIGHQPPTPGAGGPAAAILRSGNGPVALTRGSTVTTAAPPTAEELGVKWIDAGKSNISDEDRAGWKSFRSKVAMEILTTERSYVQSLNTMLKAYNDPYFEGQRGTGLTDKKVASMFTIPKTLVGIATTFLAEIETNLKNWEGDNGETIAPTFIRYAPMFRTYRDYSSTHQQVITTILGKINSRSAFTSFQTKQMSTLGCMDLASYLIMPIQRLPRYKLLLESLISKTESTHPQAQQLLQALKLISEVATSVNEAMKTALLVERYMDVQKMFRSGEAVHLWRKLLQEIPCRISRIWSASAPTKDKKEKKEKKHKFVGHDAVIFLFTDCLWIGVKTKDREKKYEDTRAALEPYPLYADEFNYKFSLLTLGQHSLSTSQMNAPLVINDHSYHHSLIITGPIHAVCVSFETAAAKDSASKFICSAVSDFEQLSRARSLADSSFSDTPSGRVTDVLCCDRCQSALYQYSKIEENSGAYNTTVNHICCNRCEGIVCTSCLQEDAMFEKASARALAPPTPASGSAGKGFGMAFRGSATPSQSTGGSKLTQILGGDSRIVSYPSNSPVHAPTGWGASPATGRWCTTCAKAPQSVAQFNDNKNDGRDTMRQSMLGLGGATLTQEDLQAIRARQNKTGTLRVNTAGDLDFGRESLTSATIPLPLPTPSSRSGQRDANNTPDEVNSPSTPSHGSISQLRKDKDNNNNNGGNEPQSVSLVANNSRNEPPSPISTSRPPVFNSIRSIDTLTVSTSTANANNSISTNNNPNNTSISITTSPSSPLLPSCGQASSPPPFVNPRASVLPPPFSPPGAGAASTIAPAAGPTSPPPFSTGLPPKQPPSLNLPSTNNNTFATAPPKIKINVTGGGGNVTPEPGSSDDDIPPPPNLVFGPTKSALPPPPTPTTVPQSKSNIPPPPFALPTPIAAGVASTTNNAEDEEEPPPPPPTVGEPVRFDPSFVPQTPTNHSVSIAPPPDPDDDEEEAAPPPPPTPKAAFQPLPKPRSNPLDPKRVKRPSI